MDEISLKETSSFVNETDISMNVSIGRNEGGGGAMRTFLNRTRPLQRRRGLHSSQNTLFKQTPPLLRRPGLHSSQNTLFKQTRPLLRRPGLHSSQDIDFHANIVRTRRCPREICLDRDISD